MECFRKILFNNGTTYAGRSSPILHTLLIFFGRKRHYVSSEIVYPIKDSRIWKSGTYPLRLNKGVPSEYLFTLLVFLFNPKSTKSHELFHPFCICSIHFLFGGSQQFPDRFGFSLWREISLVFRPVRAIRVSEGARTEWTERKFSWQACPVTSHPKSPRKTGSEAQKISWSWMVEKISRQFS